MLARVNEPDTRILEGLPRVIPRPSPPALEEVGRNEARAQARATFQGTRPHLVSNRGGAAMMGVPITETVSGYGLRAKSTKELGFSRPGITEFSLVDNGIEAVDEAKAKELVGLPEAGLAIPYRQLDGSPVMDSGKPYHRLRLNNPNHDRKYHQRAGTGVHLYIPNGLKSMTSDGSLFIIEGEFKAISLVEAGIPSVGVSGFYGFQNADKKLLPELEYLIESMQVERLYFCGDSDTALNAQFSHAAILLQNHTKQVDVLLPRLPLNGPGKGLDDCKAALGLEFLPWFEQLVKNAVPVRSAQSPARLALSLLEEASGGLLALHDSNPDFIEKRVKQLINATAANHSIQTQILDLLAANTRLTGSLLQNWVREQSNQSSTQSADHCDKSVAGLLYDGAHYFWKDDSGIYVSTSERAIIRELKYRGFTTSKAHNEATEIDVALREIQLKNNVHGSGPLCGRKPGVVTEGSFKYLVTRGPVFIAESSDQENTKALPFLEFLEAVFGKEENPHYNHQVTVFIAWLQRAREAIRKPEEHLPGQMLILVGPAGCGKSYLQLLITEMLGGRYADPSLWIQDKSSFNGNMWEAEHLMMSDTNLEESPKAKAAMRDKIKEMVANPLYPMHKKHCEQITLRPIWRISLSANDDPTSANILPTLEPSTEDKLIYFKCYDSDGYFPDENERTEHKKALLDALPAFLHLVDHFDLPDDLRSPRWGVKAWHHPEYVNLLESLQPEQELAEILTAWMDANSAPVVTLPVTELYDKLSVNGGYVFNQISKSPRHLGRQLSRLIAKEPWKHVIRREKRRIGETRTESVHYRFDSRALAKPDEQLSINDLPKNSGGMVSIDSRF